MNIPISKLDNNERPSFLRMIVDRYRERGHSCILDLYMDEFTAWVLVEELLRQIRCPYLEDEGGGPRINLRVGVLGDVVEG